MRSTEVSSAVRHIAEEAVTAEAARGRMRVRQLETALAESKEQEAAATQRGEAAAAAAAADCARRERQLNLQLEQLRDAAVQRDREAEQVNRERDRAEKAARSAVEAEAAASRRVEGLQRQLDELDGARADRDALLIKVEQLGRLVEMQAAELKRLRRVGAVGEGDVAGRGIAFRGRRHCKLGVRERHIWHHPLAGDLKAVGLIQARAACEDHVVVRRRVWREAYLSFDRLAR